MTTRAEVDAQALYDVLDLSVLARNRKAGLNIDFEIVRELTEGDLGAILDGSPAKPPSPRLKEVKFRHHQMARLVAEGRSFVEISSITGYSPAYIGSLQSDDPMFRELVNYYLTSDEIAHGEVISRMNTINMTVMEELQRRLDDGIEDWTNRELMDLSDQMSKPLVAKLGQTYGRAISSDVNGSSTSGVNISVNFVSTKEEYAAKANAQTSAGIVIDSIDVDCDGR